MKLTIFQASNESGCKQCYCHVYARRICSLDRFRYKRTTLVLPGNYFRRCLTFMRFIKVVLIPDSKQMEPFVDQLFLFLESLHVSVLRRKCKEHHIHIIICLNIDGKFHSSTFITFHLAMQSWTSKDWQRDLKPSKDLQTNYCTQFA